jgi:hypothetical protein
VRDIVEVNFSENSANVRCCFFVILVNHSVTSDTVFRVTGLKGDSLDIY